jgi:CRISPR-associated protein Cmr4
MKSIIIGMLAETSVHPGAGRSTGFVDLPVARESITDYPVIVGSSLKGALRERAREKWKDIEKKTGDKTEKELSKEVAGAFGRQDNAGDLIVSDARLLLLPIRSLTGHYKWATCPYLLERLSRDILRCGSEIIKCPKVIKDLKKGTVLAKGTGYLFLEEREFKITRDVDDSIIEAIKLPQKGSLISSLCSIMTISNGLPAMDFASMHGMP